jgi:hypothetical protein
MQTVLISALTAAVVTLLIEYFAKPYLEVRKDRIVDSHRARRDLILKAESAANYEISALGLLEPPGGAPFVEAVEDFLTKVQELEMDFKTKSRSLGFFRRTITERLFEQLGAKRRVTGAHFSDYKETFRVDSSHAIRSNKIRSQVIGHSLVDMVLLLRNLSQRIHRPWWSFFRAMLKSPPTPAG